MKKIIIAIIAVLIILTIGIFEQVYVVDFLSNVEDKTQAIMDTLVKKDIALASSMMTELETYLKSHSKILELAFPHSEFKDLPLLVGEMRGYIDADNIEEAIVRGHVILGDVLSHRTILRFSIFNIL